MKIDSLLIKTSRFFLFTFHLFIIFNGVDFNERFSLPQGTIGLLMVLNLVLFLASYLFESKVTYSFIYKSIMLFCTLISLTFVGAYFSGDISISTLSFVFTYGLLFICISIVCRFDYKDTYKYHNFIEVLVSFNILALCVFIVGVYFDINVRLFPEPWLYDLMLRFSGTFNEPSYMGYFSVVLLIYFWSIRSFKYSFVCLVFLLLSRSKLIIAILPLVVIFFIVNIFSRKEIGVKFFVISIFAILLFVFSLNLNSEMVFSLISERIDFFETKTFATRFFFPLNVLEHLVNYPIGSGLFGYKETLKPMLAVFVSSNYGLDTSELHEYLLESNSVSFAPKDVFSFFLLSFGIPGLVFYMYFWLILLTKVCKGDRS
ncbi:O-antigen ligase family protein [Aeromonas caviae]|nr:O-antigen ligase family protein [Aeromonas caviae]